MATHNQGDFYGRQICDLQAEEENLRISSVIFLAHFTPDYRKRSMSRESVREHVRERYVTRRACFRTEATGRFRWKSSAGMQVPRPGKSCQRRAVERNGRRGRPAGIASWRVRTSARLAGLFTASWHGEASARRGAARRDAERSGAAPRRSPGAASEEEVTMIYIRCYQSCSQPAIIPIIIIA